MNIEEALAEWKSKQRRMGCVSATDWFCARVPGFYPLELTEYTKGGEEYGHTVATDGSIIIDIAPYNDLPNEYDPALDGELTGAHFDGRGERWTYKTN